MGGMWVDVDPTTDPEGIVFCFDDAVAPLPAGVARMVCQQVLGARSSDTLRKGDAQRTDEVMPFEVTELALPASPAKSCGGEPSPAFVAGIVRSTLAIAQGIEPSM